MHKCKLYHSAKKPYNSAKQARPFRSEFVTGCLRFEHFLRTNRARLFDGASGKEEKEKSERKSQGRSSIILQCNQTKTQTRILRTWTGVPSTISEFAIENEFWCTYNRHRQNWMLDSVLDWVQVSTTQGSDCTFRYDHAKLSACR